MKTAYFAIFLLLLVGCIPAVCNPPYMNHEKSCCLDMNDNAVCDNDEEFTLEDLEKSFDEEFEAAIEGSMEELIEEEATIEENTSLDEEIPIVNDIAETIVEEPASEVITAPITSMSDKELLRERATVFGDALLANNVSIVYELLDPNLKSQISKDDFMFYFPYHELGTYEVYTDSGTEIFQGIRKSDVSFRVLDRVSINESTGEVRYLETNTIKDSYHVFFDFIKKDTWYVVAFEDIIITSCKEVNDCYAKNNTLHPVCIEACDEKSYVPLRDTDPFRCKNYVCECNCYNSYTDFTYPVTP